MPVARDNIGNGLRGTTSEVIPSEISFRDVIKKLDEPVSGQGAYEDVLGHHIHAKKGFEGNVNYNSDKGFSISNQLMEEMNWSHPKMTGKQRQLFKELYESGRPNTLKEHTRIAVESLQAGNASLQEARSLVAKSLWDLRKQDVLNPTRIPWYR